MNDDILLFYCQYHKLADFRESKEFQRIRQNGQLLREILDKEQKKRLLAIEDDFGLLIEDSFVAGARFGAALAVELFCGKHTQQT